MLEYGIKELDKVIIKAITPVRINGVQYDAGEPVMIIKDAGLAFADENVSRLITSGGHFNRRQIVWESKEEVNFVINSGTVDLQSLSLLLGSDKIQSYNSPIFIHIEEEVENDSTPIKTKELVDISQPLFAYNKKREKVPFTVNNDTITIHAENGKYTIFYYYKYIGDFTEMSVGPEFFTGYLSLEAYMNFYEVENQENVSAMLEIPKIKLMTGLDFRLGSKAMPNIFNFAFLGLPKKTGNQEIIYKITLLDKEIFI